MIGNSNRNSIMAMRPTELIKFDEDGFLRDPSVWSESVAQFIAATDGVGELTPEQWSVIWALREEFFKHHSPPVPRFVCHINHMQKNCVSVLFDNDRREAWRIAGLPNPGEEAKAYL
ncbi:MAG: TusE/DsrC/DsvC family sulfur relay protein [Gammaproteobacteria bacterium]|jgi:TusE/DsrC/DsvC family sulfur relay protein